LNNRQSTQDFPSYNFLELRPLKEVAAALRSQITTIVERWVAACKESVPLARPLPFGEVKDHIPAILEALSEALGTEGSGARAKLLRRSPSQGITRFQQHYAVGEVMTEDRMLRWIMIEEIEKKLDRRMTQTEQIALDMGTDLMLQQAVVAFTDHQNAQLRSAAESELKYLSFLAHDLNNNLANVTVWLQVLRKQMEARPELASEVETVDAAQQAILGTMGGMGRLLQAERLRKGGMKPQPQMVNLRTLVTNQTRQIADQAEQKNLTIEVDAPADANIEVDPELLSLVLQNLIGNAVKYSKRGTVKISAAQADDTETWTIAVADEGPGIAPDKKEKIFEAFQRGEIHAQAGVGLGLAIASQAARLLNAELAVESQLNQGATFTLTLPA
jgi:signal transduction histidine kinase